ncbi:amino acid transporter [Holotrichia oblita]|uniref:Amino acid transporter n=1 Tax=Holotrichia oblita TaxID=644536 RepID=A0ACB9TSZ5_HOLOL|nr:amino acid transporter [Holotrichia oblita]
MDSHSIHVMTIANSIIGVSIIAMPYCFKQCGIILSIIMLIFSSIISRLSCHFLLKSAIRARLRTFEFLAYHAFGSLGKFVVEIGMIGFLLGTCIAFFVVMGDLGPEIVAEMIGIKNTNTLRSGILISLAIFCVLPLGLLRNVDSLNAVCIATIGFYGCLVLKIMAESSPHILTGDWYNKVEFWRTEGALQCIPIFSMALFCQTQLFEIYQAIPNASLEKMNALIRIAVNICTCVYIFVGIFGYIAFSEKTFTGNVLLSLTPSVLTEVIKIGFVLSLAFSFPLIIFPCRASLFSLIYRPTYAMLHDGGAHFIPETKFRTITIFIILISLIIGILIPNIELVLGLVGSTIGVSICVLFPATCFICMVKKNTNERILAQMMLFIGIVVMVLGTYANVNAVDDITLGSVTQQSDLKPPVVDLHKPEDQILAQIQTTDKSDIPNVKVKENIVRDDVIKEIRHEPPQPIEPAESKEIKSKDDAKLQEVPVESKSQPKESELREIRREPPQPVEPEQQINEIKRKNLQ